MFDLASGPGWRPFLPFFARLAFSMAASIYGRTRWRIDLAHWYSVARSANPAGINTTAGPGVTIITMPAMRRASPTTRTVTRQTNLLVAFQRPCITTLRLSGRDPGDRRTPPA